MYVSNFKYDVCECVYTIVTPSVQECTHDHNGWYSSVPFLWFNIPIYCCWDCWKVLYGKELKEFKNKLKGKENTNEQN